MDESVYDLLDDLEKRTTALSPALSPVFHPAFIPSGSSHFHDRTLNDETRYSHEFNSGLEKLDAFGIGLSLLYDCSSLKPTDLEMLGQPYEDRHRRAVEGRARLSLPRPWNTYTEPSTLVVGNYDQEQTQKSCYHKRDIVQPQNTNLISSNDSNSSSTGFPSSPALKASQRHNKHYLAPINGIKRRREASKDTQDPSQKLQESPDFQPSPAKVIRQQQNESHHHIPTVNGIKLVSTSELPNNIRGLFSFKYFNTIQSKCFPVVYESGDNFVLSAPTGSGKTAVLELAICRLLSIDTSNQFKIVYQAPTKSLCSERQRDWSMKFNQLKLQCVELTGDSDISHLKALRDANIIITTPEKWDATTRKWKNHENLMRLVKLFLIDEVHTVMDDRGATLEAIVSRMKSIGSHVRFIALSATIPNFQDIAAWLGKDSLHQNIPAICEQFGEDFRPVKLQKHVIGYPFFSNDFAFTKFLGTRLPDVIVKYSQKKPIIIFCPTRASCIQTAKLLSNWWTTQPAGDRCWEAPHHAINNIQDADLRNCTLSAVAFHHAGLLPGDRCAIEKAYLEGNLNVICSTSTLAVGINLPCHFVIIQNTVSYQGNFFKECADIDIMQMLGRAGRPQFDNSAIAVIMTRQDKATRYEAMVSGQQIIESCFHRNLIDHLNAEIGLGTISDLNTAKQWLSGTFLAVRLRHNTDYYQLDGGTQSVAQDIDERLSNICTRDIKLLQDHDLISNDEKFKTTAYGDAMTRNCVQYETMKIFLSLPPKATAEHLISAISQACEFKEVRFRAGEKPIYKGLNKSDLIRYPISVDLALPSHKVSLIIQSVLSGNELFTDQKNLNHKMQYTAESAMIFKRVSRLVRCIIDCKLYEDDSIAAKNALMLGRSLGAKAWDDSPAQLRQLGNIGVVAVRKLVSAGIKSIEELEFAEPHKIEMVLNRNPPYGLKLLDKLKSFPKLRISMRMIKYSVRKSTDGIDVHVSADIGFLNKTPPHSFEKIQVYVCLLAEISSGKKVYFYRTSAKMLGTGREIFFTATLTNPTESINCYVSCDEIAGTMRQATLKPEIPEDGFPQSVNDTTNSEELQVCQRSHQICPPHNPIPMISHAIEEFDDGGIDDADLIEVTAENLPFENIDDFDDRMLITSNPTINNSNTKGNTRKTPLPLEKNSQEPRRLDNGNWACNHRCKNKKTCKHMCCREGLEKPPKRTTKTMISTQTRSKTALKQPQVEHIQPQKQLTLRLSNPSSGNAGLSCNASQIEQIDLTQSDTGPKSLESAHFIRPGALSKKLVGSRHSPVNTQKTPISPLMSGRMLVLPFLKSPQNQSSDHGHVDSHNSEPLSPEHEVLSTQISQQDTDNFDDMDILEDVIQLQHDDEDGCMDSMITNTGLDVMELNVPPTKMQDEHSITRAALDDSNKDALDPPIICPQQLATLDNKSPLVAPDSSWNSSPVTLVPCTPLKEVPLISNNMNNPPEMEDHHLDTGRESPEQKPQQVEDFIVPPGFEDIEPWLLQEFRDVVEFV